MTNQLILFTQSELVFMLIGLLVIAGLLALTLLNARRKTVAYQELAAQKKEVEQKNHQIKKSLIEKDALLKEIHHRVKNNLQMVSSLLQLQARKFNNPDIVKAMQEGQGRIKSMATIHHMLYENDDITNIDFRSYMKKLTHNLANSMGSQTANIVVEQQIDEVHLNLDTAIPLGMIANELLYNCYKYAFTGRDTGNIRIVMKAEEAHQLRLTFVDNGIGLPPDYEEKRKQSLGMRLVEMLTLQLEGEFSLSSTSEGTKAEIVFRYEPDDNH